MNISHGLVLLLSQGEELTFLVNYLSFWMNLLFIVINCLLFEIIKMRLLFLIARISLMRSVLVGIFAVLTGAYCSPAFAQLGLSPLVLEEQAQRGRSQGVITLLNSTDRPIRARVYSEPFTYGQNGFVSLTSAPADLSPYLQFSPREVVIPAGAEQRVRVLSLFPSGLPEGEYRAVLFAEELTEVTADNTLGNDAVAAIKVRIGATVYVHQGDLSADLSGQSAALASDRQTLELVVSNQGQATARSRVNWQLLQNDGSEMAAGETDEQTVIAGGDRLFSLPLSDALPSGSYSLQGEIHWVTLGEAHTRPFTLPVMVP